MALRWLTRILGLPSGEPARPLLNTLIAEGRDPDWFLAGEAPDTLDGRFEVQALVTALALLRIEQFGKDGAELFKQLAEAFADTMEMQVREIGLGEGVMAKHVGRMMNLLGGRITGLRNAQSDEDIGAWLQRTLYKLADPAPSSAAIDVAIARIRALRARLATATLADLYEGRIPE